VICTISVCVLALCASTASLAQRPAHQFQTSYSPVSAVGPTSAPYFLIEVFHFYKLP
jgi:hypothetical protein